MKPLLSILTPSVPGRSEQLDDLCNQLSTQIGDLAVEHLVFLDNKRRTVGEKRDALLRIARGKYIAFVDDDDWIADDYIFELLKAAESDPDVITFRQGVELDAIYGEVEFRLGHPNEQFQPGQTTKRNAWHVCPWRRALALQSHFPAINYGEDWQFAAPLCALKDLREVHIPKILHYYRFNSATTQAPPQMSNHG